ncbi:molybdenum cofactor guanylyltransferase [Buchananella felis]|uniref:molybdenum cofactor guanylyltransferase n=1 Tax=Buchananella felis TaxID=3231492 RepID=UPI0035288158
MAENAQDRPQQRRIDAVVLAGGQGSRLGGVSKADLDVGGRLLDRVIDALRPHVTGTIVVVAPQDVAVPAGVKRTMEEPPGGGPLAGIGAGLGELEPGAAGDLVIVCGVDTPGLAGLLARLVPAALASLEAGGDGALIHGGEPEPFDQYLQAAYGLGALREALSAPALAGPGARPGPAGPAGPGQSSRAAGPPPALHGRGVRRTFRHLRMERVRASQEECLDLDTPADLTYWRQRLG